MSFITSGADPKPTQYCVGEIAQVSPTKQSSTGKYLVTHFVINPLGSANSKANVWVTWHPDFLRPGYAPSQESDSGKKRVYDSNIARDPKGFSPNCSSYDQQVGLASLQGLCGSNDKFNEIATELQQAFSESSDVDSLVEAVDKIFASLMGTPVGYVLKQQWVNCEGGVVNEKGYPVKVRGKYMETAGLFYPTVEVHKEIMKAIEGAEKYAQKKEVFFVRPFVCFSPEVPF